VIPKSLILIHLAFTFDPDAEVSYPDLMTCESDPKPVIPDPAYHVTTRIHGILGFVSSGISRSLVSLMPQPIETL